MYFRKKLRFLLTESLKKAAGKQKYDKLREKFEKIPLDISEQYSSFKVNNEYLATKVRNMHLFQMSLVDRVIGEFQDLVVVDIGDSSGTHLQYLKELYSGDRNIKFLSVNLDDKAVEKINRKGFKAIHARAEELYKYNIDANIFMCFETLEHLMNPCRFLYDLSTGTSAKYLIVTVPYLKNSRVGIHHIRRAHEEADTVNAENTHIFELSPADWKLLFQFSGWRVVFEQIYLQYPQKHWLWITKFYWKRFDFEGFYGAVLTRDHTWSNLYNDWQKMSLK